MVPIFGHLLRPLLQVHVYLKKKYVIINGRTATKSAELVFITRSKFSLYASALNLIVQSYDCELASYRAEGINLLLTSNKNLGLICKQSNTKMQSMSLPNSTLFGR